MDPKGGPNLDRGTMGSLWSLRGHQNFGSKKIAFDPPITENELDSNIGIQIFFSKFFRIYST